MTIGGIFSTPSFFRPSAAANSPDFSRCSKSVDADVAEAVDLAADPDPTFDDVVVVGGLARAESGTAGLPGLHHGP